MKGILFKPWKIKFIAEHPDMELQTRRVIKPQPPEGASIWLIENATTGESHFSVRRCNPWYTIKPRYQVGETVYIKEAWATDYRFNHLKPSELRSQVPKEYSNYGIVYLADGWREACPNGKIKARSPLHLPEWAARYFITITDVRAESLRDITPQEARLEGFDKKAYPVLAFVHTWNSTNKDYPWESNPWIFAYTFKQERRR